MPRASRPALRGPHAYAPRLERVPLSPLAQPCPWRQRRPAQVAPQVCREGRVPPRRRARMPQPARESRLSFVRSSFTHLLHLVRWLELQEVLLRMMVALATRVAPIPFPTDSTTQPVQSLPFSRSNDDDGSSPRG